MGRYIDIEMMIDIIKEDAHGIKFYTREMLYDLIEKVEEICQKLEIDSATNDSEIISIVNNYIKHNVKLREPYFDCFNGISKRFDKNELMYRTAYGALTKNEAMCAGFVEAERIILEQFGIKTYTALTRLPGRNKRLVHYVTIAECNEENGKKYMVLDPERLISCEKKGMSFERYIEGMTYAVPTKDFTDDVTGTNGLGMEIEKYLATKGVFSVEGTKRLDELVEKIKEYNEEKEKEDDKDDNSDR